MDEVISRTMFCKHCNANDTPHHGQYFVVWGHTRQVLVVKTVHQTIRSGYTPHIIVYADPPIITEKGVEIKVTCGIDGCGISITGVREDGTYEVQFDRIETRYLSPNDFNALVNNWKNTGYETI